MLSWAVQRDIFYTERDRIRKEFEANLHLKDLGVVEKCIADGEAKLAKFVRAVALYKATQSAEARATIVEHLTAMRRARRVFE